MSHIIPKKAHISTAVTVILVVAVIAITGYGKSLPAIVAQPSTQETTTVPTTNQPSAPKPATGITAATVAQHNTVSSCYSIINGNVYDLTPWISKHPGGEGAIESICGKDGSDAFNGQHGGSSRPEQILQNFFIGTLVK